jgi:hypothetical protein
MQSQQVKILRLPIDLAGFDLFDDAYALRWINDLLPDFEDHLPSSFQFNAAIAATWGRSILRMLGDVFCEDGASVTLDYEKRQSYGALLKQCSDQ